MDKCTKAEKYASMAPSVAHNKGLKGGGLSWVHIKQVVSGTAAGCLASGRARCAKRGARLFALFCDGRLNLMGG